MLVSLAALSLSPGPALPSALDRYFRRLERDLVYLEYSEYQLFPSRRLLSGPAHLWIKGNTYRQESGDQAAVPAFDPIQTLVFDGQNRLVINPRRRIYYYDPKMVYSPASGAQPYAADLSLKSLLDVDARYALVRPPAGLATEAKTVGPSTFRLSNRRYPPSVPWWEWKLSGDRLVSFSWGYDQPALPLRYSVEIKRFDYPPSFPPFAFSTKPPAGYRLENPPPRP